MQKVGKIYVDFRWSCSQSDSQAEGQQDRQKPDISQEHHTTSHYKSSRQWLLLKRLFWPKVWHNCHIPYFLEQFLNVLIQQQSEFFLSSRSELKITYTCWLIQYLFFYLLFGCHTITFGSLSREHLHPLNVNFCDFIIYWLKGHWEPQ